MGTTRVRGILNDAKGVRVISKKPEILLMRIASSRIATFVSKKKF